MHGVYIASFLSFRYQISEVNRTAKVKYTWMAVLLWSGKKVGPEHSASKFALTLPPETVAPVLQVCPVNLYLK